VNQTAIRCCQVSRRLGNEKLMLNVLLLVTGKRPIPSKFGLPKLEFRR
jgi:hypothetical protein